MAEAKGEGPIDHSDAEDLARRADAAGYAGALHLRVVEAKPGHVRAAVRLGPEHVNFFGMPHGAAVFSVMDHALSVAVNSLGRPAVLIQASVNYLASAKLGEEVIGEAEVLHAGRTSVVSRLEARGPDGKLLATGQATCLFVGGK